MFPLLFVITIIFSVNEFYYICVCGGSQTSKMYQGHTSPSSHHQNQELAFSIKVFQLAAAAATNTKGAWRPHIDTPINAYTQQNDTTLHFWSNYRKVLVVNLKRAQFAMSY